MVCTYHSCVQEMVLGRRTFSGIGEEHNVATGGAWVDDIHTTPHIICGEEKPEEFVVIDDVVLQQYEFTCVHVTGLLYFDGRGDVLVTRMLREQCSFLSVNLLDARE
jgi:hypothetical protein